MDPKLSSNAWVNNNLFSYFCHSFSFIILILLVQMNCVFQTLDEVLDLVLQIIDFSILIFFRFIKMFEF
jgi:hypothetical protein